MFLEISIVNLRFTQTLLGLFYVNCLTNITTSIAIPQWLSFKFVLLSCSLNNHSSCSNIHSCKVNNNTNIRIKYIHTISHKLLIKIESPRTPNKCQS